MTKRQNTPPTTEPVIPTHHINAREFPRPFNRLLRYKWRDPFPPSSFSLLSLFSFCIAPELISSSPTLRVVKPLHSLYSKVSDFIFYGQSSLTSSPSFVGGSDGINIFTDLGFFFWGGVPHKRTYWDFKLMDVSGRGESFPISSSRKEWRIVSEHPSSADKEVDHSKLGQSDERMVYEVQQGREPADVDFCSITIDGCSEDDLFQQRLNSISRQRDHFQQLEIELKAQVIARSEIVGMQNSFDAQIKEQANAAVQLQDKLHEREQIVHELERKIEEQDREIKKIKLDNEAAWEKEDLLREQNKELASFRRERDTVEAERAQHIQQIHELREHLQEKDRQLIDLQEQNRGAQDAILYRDEQLREAQTWMARVQMDALQSNLNHSLQVQLRERTEQCNQLWDNCQRQFVEMERLHMHIQQLQLELAEARERSGTYNEESHASHVNSKDVSQFVQNNGGQLDANGSNKPSGNSVVLSNGNVDGISSFTSIGTTSGQADGIAGAPISPSLLGMPPYLPPGQMTALHPFVVHQQGISNSVTSHIPQFHPVPEVSSAQHWQNQQAGPESSQISGQVQFSSTQTDQNLVTTDAQYNYETSVIDSNYINGQIGHGVVTDSEIPSTGVAEVQEAMGNGYLVDTQPQPSLQEISSQFHDALRLNRHDKNNESQGNVAASTDYGLQSPDLSSEQSEPLASALPQSEPPMNSVKFVPAKFVEIINDNRNNVLLPEAFVPAGLSNASVGEKEPESLPLDERLLLACIVRTIPAGGRIRIGSTLPNRLGKMLAPLHWHDYKRKYGKLEDFVAAHPELFVIERDYIQLREGAQKMIAATAAAAKVAAAAAASYPHSSLLPSVAVTPMAQSFRPKKVPSSAVDHPSLASASHNQHLNGVSFSAAGGASNVKILSKSSRPLEFSGPSGQSMTVGNGANLEGSVVGSNATKSSTNGRGGTNLNGKHQGRNSGAASVSRR